MNFLDIARSIQPDLVELRHYLHAHPELGHDLTVTRAKVCAELDKLDIPYVLPECGGIVAFVGKGGGKRILLRADMDALPIKEQTGLPFASQNEGNMHACGHDTHMTMLLGAARLLKEREAELSGQVVLCFQDAEEVMDGARKMIESGALDPLPDYAFAFHIFPSDHLPSGTISCTAGKYMTSTDDIQVKVRGKSSHGSAPHNGVNPITASLHIIQALTDLMRYEVDAQVPSVLTICQIHSGSASNIIPDFCEFSGSLRMVNEETREYVKLRMMEIVKSAETAFRVNAEVITTGIPMVYNDPEFVQRAHDWIAEMPGAKIRDVGTQINMVSEDFAEFGLHIPSAMFEIASLSPEGRHFPGHNPCVLFDDEALYQGSAAFAQVAMRYLQE